MSKLTVGVVFGGRSVEHEVSLLSARSILRNINPDKYQIFPVFIEKNGAWRRASVDSWLRDGELKIFSDSFLSPSLNPDNPVFFEIGANKVRMEHKIDVIFPVLHGTYGEDGTVQGLFELMGIPFVGASVLGSSVGMDKILMKTIFRECGLPVVKFVGFYAYEWESKKDKIREQVLDAIGIPCFVKAANLGSSVSISKVKLEDELDKAMDFACNFSHRIMVEKAVSNPREIEVSVLGNENPIASLPGEIVPHREFYDYVAKYMEQGTGLIAPVKLEKEVVRKFQEYAIKAYKAIDCEGMGRVDFLMDGDTQEISISEINTIPGFTQISMYPKLWEVSGIKYPELISKLIDLAIHRHEMKKKLTTERG
ncbi:MAG TPA: D-alanine--D-alanine ligase family protein [Thermodesulfobacteriota bacterium]|nr:D-alanine--D-alanine ligase family protein [Thermodesulfobacteriota bacterium]